MSIAHTAKPIMIPNEMIVTTYRRQEKVKMILHFQKFLSFLTGLNDKFAQRSHGADGSSLKDDHHHKPVSGEFSFT